jgi:hypothetical protein
LEVAVSAGERFGGLDVVVVEVDGGEKEGGGGRTDVEGGGEHALEEMQFSEVEVEVVGIAWDGRGGCCEHSDIVGVSDSIFGDDFGVVFGRCILIFE